MRAPLDFRVESGYIKNLAILVSKKILIAAHGFIHLVKYKLLMHSHNQIGVHVDETITCAYTKSNDTQHNLLIESDV